MNGEPYPRPVGLELNRSPLQRTKSAPTSQNTKRVKGTRIVESARKLLQIEARSAAIGEEDVVRWVELDGSGEEGEGVIPAALFESCVALLLYF